MEGMADAGIADESLWVRCSISSFGVFDALVFRAWSGHFLGIPKTHSLVVFFFSRATGFCGFAVSHFESFLIIVLNLSFGCFLKKVHIFGILIGLVTKKF